MSNYKLQDENAKITFGSTEKFEIKKSSTENSLAITTKTTDLAVQNSILIEDDQVTILNPTSNTTISQDTNSKVLATTEFTQSLLGNKNVTEITSSYTISASNTPLNLDYSHCGKLLQLVGAIASFWNVPSAINKKGYCLSIWNNSSVLLTLTSLGGSFLNTPNSTGNNTKIYPTSFTEFCSDGYNWIRTNEIFPNSYALKQAYFISANGTYTPSAGVRYYEAWIQAGGGSGGGSADTGSGQISIGGGGGAGGLLVIRSSDLTPVPIIIGGGGVGVTGAAGSNGGTTFFGTTSVSAGSGGDTSGILPNGTISGFGIGGIGGQNYTLQANHNFLNIIPGQYGGYGFYASSNGSSLSGSGGSTFFGTGGNRVFSNLPANSAGGSSYGAGGGGTVSFNTEGIARPGGNGTQGIIFVKEYV